MNPSHFLLTLVATARILSSCSTGEPAATHVLTEAERQEGWELIFDGSSLDGWGGLNMEEVSESHWRIEREMLVKVDRDEIPPGPDGERNRVSTCCLTGRFKTLNSTSSGTQSRWLTAGSSTMSLKSSLLNMGIPIQHLVLSIRFLMIQSIPRSPKIPPGRLPASMNLSTHLRIATSIRQVNGILDVSSLTAIVGSTGSTAKKFFHMIWVPPK